MARAGQATQQKALSCLFWVSWEMGLGSTFQIPWTKATTPFIEGHPDVPLVRNGPSSSAISTMVLVEL